MNKFVYLLWTHNEYGPENISATTDRAALAEMAIAMAYMWDGTAEFEGVREKLAVLLEKTDEELLNVGSDHSRGIHSLMSGWGGLNFQVVRLYERP